MEADMAEVQNVSVNPLFEQDSRLEFEMPEGLFDDDKPEEVYRDVKVVEKEAEELKKVLENPNDFINMEFGDIEFGPFIETLHKIGEAMKRAGESIKAKFGRPEGERGRFFKKSTKAISEEEADSTASVDKSGDSESDWKL